jgi:hypothetical protein
MSINIIFVEMYFVLCAVETELLDKELTQPCSLMTPACMPQMAALTMVSETAASFQCDGVAV